jgi:hypothetical protein
MYTDIEEGEELSVDITQDLAHFNSYDESVREEMTRRIEAKLSAGGGGVTDEGGGSRSGMEVVGEVSARTLAERHAAAMLHLY